MPSRQTSIAHTTPKRGRGIRAGKRKTLSATQALPAERMQPNIRKVVTTSDLSCFGPRWQLRAFGGVTQKERFFFAIKHGHTVRVKRLLTQNPSLLRIKDSDEKTPLQIAVEKKHSNILKNLLQSMDEDLFERHLARRTDRYGNTPLHIAAKEGSENVLEVILQSMEKHKLLLHLEVENFRRHTPLLLALQKKHLGVAELLVNAGAKVTKSTFDKAKEQGIDQEFNNFVLQYNEALASKFLIREGFKEENEATEQGLHKIIASYLVEEEALL